MIIDFHTHIFPERIASRTIDFLAEKGNVTPNSDGTDSGLCRALTDAGVELGITLPVVTAPKQFDSINSFAAEINKKYGTGSAPRLISFAGIHPACENIREKMRFIKESGFLGVKLHPDYQGTYFDDDGYVEIIKAARDNDLIVVTHAGVDIGFPGEPVRCTPERIRRVIKRVPYKKLVLAHMGANDMFDDVYNLVAGEDVYLDTAYVLRFIGKEMFTKILEKHGEDRILFASDSPWSDIKNDVDILKSYALDERAEEKIFSKNAKGLLGI